MKRSLLVIFLVVMVPALAVGWLVGTRSGLDFVIQRVLQQVPGDVSVESSAGRLAGTVQLTGLRVAGMDPQIEIAEVQTRLRLRDLWVGRITLDGPQLRGVRLVAGDTPREVAASAPAQWQFPEPQLPFELAVENLSVEALSYVRADPSQLDLARLSLERLSYGQTRWALSGLVFESPRLSGSGDLSYQAAGVHELTSNFKLSIQNIDKKTDVRLHVVGDQDRLTLSQDFSGAIQGTLTGTFIPNADWSLQGRVEVPEPEALHGDLPGMPLAARLDLAGKENVAGGELLLDLADYAPLRIALEADGLPGDPVLRSLEIAAQGSDARLRFTGMLAPADGLPRLDGRLDWQALHWPPDAPARESLVNSPRGDFKVEGSGGQYRLDGQLALAREGLDGFATATGSLDLSGPRPRFDLRGAWDRLELRVVQRSFDLLAGSYSLAGDTDDYELACEFSLATGDFPGMAVSADARGDSRRLILRRFAIASPSGELESAGQLSWQGKQAFEFDLTARNFDPGVFDPAWPGSLSLNAAIRGDIDEAGVNMHLEASKIAGALRGLPLGGRARLVLAGGQPDEVATNLRWGDSLLQLNGQLGDDLDLRWDLRIPDLGRHSPRGAGLLESQGRLRGAQEEPMIQLQAKGEGLRYKDLEIGQLTVDGGLDAGNQQMSSLSIAARQLAWGDQSADTLRISASGTPRRHDGELSVESGALSLTSRFAGRWSNADWRGRLSATELNFRDSAWTQTGQAEVAVQSGALDLRAFCMSQDTGEICVTASVPVTGYPGFRLAVNNLPLAELGLLLPAGLGYEGAISGNIDLGAGPGGQRGDARFSVQDARIWQGEGDDAIQLIDFKSISGEARLAEQRLVVSLQGTSIGQEPLLVRVQLPFKDWAVADGPVEGRFDGELRELGALTLLIPDLVDVEGRLLASLQLDGTLASPLWSGEIRLQEARALVPRLGLDLQDIAGVLDARGSSLGLDLQAASGGGVLRISGQSELSATGASGRFDMVGERFLASDLPQARVRLTPDLRLQVAGRKLNLSGDVYVDEARIEPRDLSTAVQRSADERLMLDSERPLADDGWSLTSKVGVEFSDEIFFNGFGLQARIVGSLTVSDAPNSVTTATGELGIVDGTYRAYGKNLEIRRGRLLFTGGPLANPGLDLMATRTIRETVEAGVLVRATLRNPEVSLYSDPSMPPPQVLSYLLVGQPLADIGGADQELVNDTAARLASAGGGLLAQQLGRRMGLEGLTVTSAGDGDQASLVIGKYLSPKLYASYGVGLFENINTLRLRYILSSRWTVRAESGLNQSIDLEYSVQK